ncbi:hypothetical protein [Streptomyces exfoliatus]|uniref:hypothetical protein n=1 Tax=Streptomyces exfoliatus TaxID=1905 RepID=UPI000D11F906|nr:hypothetical protein [Streptomyces exfoliatus]
MPAPTPVPVVVVPDLPRATTHPVQRRATLPLASTRSLTPSLPGAEGTSAPARTSTAPSPAPLFTPTPTPAPAPAPTVQRSSAGPAAGGTTAPLGSPRPVVPLAPPSAARPVTRPVVVQRQSAPAPAPEAAPVPTVSKPPVVTPAPLQRATSPTAPAPRATTVTRTAPAPAAVQRTAGPAPTGPAVGDAESPSHLDELARRLVTPLSRLLRAELRADRERVGRLRDHGR